MGGESGPSTLSSDEVGTVLYTSISPYLEAFLVHMKNMIMFIQECIVFRAYLLSARSIFFQTILVIVIDKYAPNLI